MDVFRLGLSLVQNFESFTVTFEQGVTAGNNLLALLVELEPELETQCDVFLKPDELQPIYDWIVTRSQRYAYPYLEGFFSRIIKPTELNSCIVTLWGADEFIENQSQYAPICNLPSEAKFFQFGYWCGDYCDGDGWCIDLDDQCVRCLIVTGGDENMDLVRRNTYGVFPSLEYLTSYLRTSAVGRGWLTS